RWRCPRLLWSPGLPAVDHHGRELLCRRRKGPLRCASSADHGDGRWRQSARDLDQSALQPGCGTRGTLAAASERPARRGERHRAPPVRVDDLGSWITAVSADPLTTFRAYNTNFSGIGDYDLADATDQVVPFDYDHSGKLDHLVAYRPGTGIIHVVKHNADDT